ncbi:SDR family NAD(P)-dependent oxidoreductase [Paraburkholderia phymatum]|uniref:SDR family NAD(P)-dependent oxidoreductase n=1 Tax=Paraburkholderia phymatum TaxID=148447 RepID=UPI003D173D13
MAVHRLSPQRTASPVRPARTILTTGTPRAFAAHREFQVNFFAAVDLCKEAIRHFRETGGGRIVNVASRAKRDPRQNSGPLAHGGHSH